MGYGAVMRGRCNRGDGNYDVRIILPKLRFAPIKVASIMRPELGLPGLAVTGVYMVRGSLKYIE